MLDTHEIARELTAAGIHPDHADAITKADLTALELRLVKWMIGIVLAGAGLVIAALRLVG